MVRADSEMGFCRHALNLGSKQGCVLAPDLFAIDVDSVACQPQLYTAVETEFSVLCKIETHLGIQTSIPSRLQNLGQSLA